MAVDRGRGRECGKRGPTETRNYADKLHTKDTDTNRDIAAATQLQKGKERSGKKVKRERERDTNRHMAIDRAGDIYIDRNTAIARDTYNAFELKMSLILRAH